MSLSLEQFDAYLRIVENLVGPADAIVMIEWTRPLGLGSPADRPSVLQLAYQAHLYLQSSRDTPTSTGSSPRLLSQRGPFVRQLLVVEHVFARRQAVRGPHALGGGATQVVVLGAERVLVFLPVVHLQEVLAVLLLGPLAEKLGKPSGDVLLRHGTSEAAVRLHLADVEAGQLVDGVGLQHGPAASGLDHRVEVLLQVHHRLLFQLLHLLNEVSPSHVRSMRIRAEEPLLLACFGRQMPLLFLLLLNQFRSRSTHIMGKLKVDRSSAEVTTLS